MGPTCQWQHRSSGRRGCNQPRCSRASATPDQALEGESSTAAATPPAQDPRGPPSQSHSQPPPWRTRRRQGHGSAGPLIAPAALEPDGHAGGFPASQPDYASQERRVPSRALTKPPKVGRHTPRVAMAAHQPPVVGVVEMAPGTVDGSLLFPLAHPSPFPTWCHNVRSAQWRQGHPAPRIRCRLLQHGGGPRRRQRRRANPGAHHEDLGGGNRGNSCSERSQWHGHFRRGGSPGDVHARPAGRRRPGK